MPSELKKDIAELEKEKLEKFKAKTTLLDLIKEREKRIAEAEVKAVGDSLYTREINHVTGAFDYFMVRTTKLKPTFNLRSLF